MPFTPSMKLNAFTKAITQSATATVAAARSAGGRIEVAHQRGGCDEARNALQY